jgi:predicted lipid-binding transport protein (Tim44 family)
MAADLIIYAIIAAALVFWLKNVLGTRHGDERDRPNPFAPKNDNQPPEDDGVVIDIARPGQVGAPASVGGMMGAAPDPLKITKTTLASRVRIETPAAGEALRTLASAQPGFTLERFIEGAEYAFEVIVTAFARGDRLTLKGLLAPSVYQDFDQAITARAARGETVDTKIEAVRGMDVIAAQIQGNQAFITVRFTAQEVCIIRNAAGAITSGALDQTTTMIDLWTFGREVNSTDPTWFLFETRDERAEDHKTPVPESRL